VRCEILHNSVSTRLVLDGGDCDDNDACGVRVSSSDLNGDGRLDVVVSSLRTCGNGQDGIFGDTSSCPSLRCSWDLSSVVSSDNGSSGVRLHGLHRGETTAMRLSDVSCAQNGSHGMRCVSSSLSVSRCDSSGNSGVGMWMDSLSGDYSSSVADGNTSSGLRLSGHESAHVVQQSSSRNAGHGHDIDDDCDGYSSSRCVSVGNDGDGFNVRSSSCAMDHNSSRSNKTASIVAGGPGTSSVSLEACRSSGGGGATGGAVSVHASSVFVARCVVTDSSGDGLVVSGATGGVVRDNVCSSNSGRGITISTSHVEYSSNRCVSNSLDGLHVVSGSSNVVHSNLVSNNTTGGLHFTTGGNRIFDNSSGDGSLSSFRDDSGGGNDVSVGGTASSVGPPNIGF
jgi:hypothetical protein